MARKPSDTSAPKRPQLRVPPPGPEVTLRFALDDGLSRIYALGDGEERVAVEESPGRMPGLIEKNVALSPDNRRVTYATFGGGYDGHMRLWVARVEGGEPRLLADIPHELWTARPVWSPDSTRIGYVRTQSPGERPRLELWTVDLRTGKNRYLFSHPSFGVGVFYNADAQPLRWTLTDEIEYRDDARDTLYAVDARTGALRARRAELTAPESPIRVVRTAATVPVMSQNDPRWRFAEINPCGHSMGNSGCAITTTSMSFSSSGVTRTPQSLNEDLDDQACPIYWDYASRYHSDGKLELWGQWRFEWDLLDLSLRRGRPAMVELSDADDYRDATLLHWVLVVGGEGQGPDGYRIYDPWDGTTYKTLAYYTEKGYTLKRAYVYAPKTPEKPKPEPAGK